MTPATLPHELEVTTPVPAPRVSGPIHVFAALGTHVLPAPSPWQSGPRRARNSAG